VGQIRFPLCESQEKGNHAMYRVLFNRNRAHFVFILKKQKQGTHDRSCNLDMKKKQKFSFPNSKEEGTINK
jgi:hypothetical protein